MTAPTSTQPQPEPTQPIRSGVDFDGEALFLIEGELRALQLPDSDTTGHVDAEELVKFSARVGDRAVRGLFLNANALAEGDHVSAVVSQRGAGWQVHSLMRSRDHLLLMPPNTFAGKRALLRKSIRNVCLGSLAMWVCIGAFFGWNLAQEASISAEQIDNLKFGAVVAFVAPLAVMLFTEVPTYRDMRYFGQYASAIFSVYGFPRPDSLNVLKGMTVFPGGPHGFYAISAKVALARHGIEWES